MVGGKTSKGSHPPSSSSGNRPALNRNPTTGCPGIQYTSSTSSQVSNSSSTCHLDLDRLGGGSQPKNLTPQRQVPAGSSSAVKTLQSQVNSNRGASQPPGEYAPYIPESMHHLIFKTFGWSHRAKNQQPVPEGQSSRPEVQSSRPEVQSTRPEVQSTLPEVQSTRHEVQSTRHEVQSTRPEVQSTRPEVQSTRPEVQSALPAVQSTRPGVQSTRPGVQSTRPPVQSSRPAGQSSRSSINDTRRGNTNHGNHIGSMNRAELDKMRKDLEKQRQFARALQEELDMANAQYQSQRLAYDQLLREKEKLAQDQARLLAENQDYGQRVSRLAVVVENKKLYVGPQQSDNGISEQFEGLYRRVRDFSFPFLSEHQVPDALCDKRFRLILFGLGVRAVEDYQGFLAVKKTRRLMVQSILGYYIRYGAFRRFPEESGECGPTLDQCLSQRNSASIDALEQTLRQSNFEITQQELNDWRALTLTLVSRAEASIPGMNTLVEAQRKQMRQELVKNLMGWISEWAKPQEDRGRLRQELGVIFDAAFELSLLLRKQRALWFVNFPDVSGDGELRFDPTTMEDVLSKHMDEGADEMQRGKTVSLVIFPGLYKRGNTSGENYDSEICVVKAQVKCIDGVPAVDRSTGYTNVAMTDHKLPNTWTGYTGVSMTDHKLPDTWTGHGYTGVSMTDHNQPGMQHPPYPPL